ncbi:MAG: RHS repeat-associated core domain-containing protein [Bacteroidetes bacterium]|nr:RHS repeat-associated core domain-containing protein [Bacteroidota bacterium]
MRITRKLSTSDNKYTYNGKEHENEFGLNWYHYGARYYDPAIGRWWAVDPAREFHSPYLFSANSPIVYSDPDGKETMNNVQYNYAVGNLVRIFQTLHIADMYNLGYQANSQTDGGIYLKPNFDLSKVSDSPIYKRATFLDNLIAGSLGIITGFDQSVNTIASDPVTQPLVNISLSKQEKLDFTITGFDYKYKKDDPTQTRVVVTILITRSDGSTTDLGTMDMDKVVFEKLFEIEKLYAAGEEAKKQGQTDGNKGKPSEGNLWQSMNNFFSSLKGFFNFDSEKKL